MTAADLPGALFVLGGGYFLVVGGLGFVRLPDLFTRMHAAGVGDTLGVGLIMVGFMFLVEPGGVTIKLVLVLLLLLLTGPVATHALAKAALHGGIRPIAEEIRPSGPRPETDPPWNT